MKLTIVVPDSVVGIDGEFRQLDLSQLPENIRAVQWDGVKGHVEFNDGTPNEILDDISMFADVVLAWNALTPPPPTPPTLDKVKADLIEDIKAERDKLTLNGGHKIGNYWYHSNEISLIQQIALNGIADKLILGGQPDTLPVTAEPWKTLSGEYVTLTVGIAKNFIQSALVQQSALFNAAKQKIDEVNAFTHLDQTLGYDPQAGFPEVYQA